MGLSHTRTAIHIHESAFPFSRLHTTKTRCLSLLVLKKKYHFHCKIQKYSADIPLIKNGLSDERNQVAARRAVIYEVSRKGHVLVRINQLSVSNLPRSAAFLHPDGFNWVLSLMLCCLCRNGFRGLDSQPIKTCFWQTGYTNMCKFQKKKHSNSKT